MEKPKTSAQLKAAIDEISSEVEGGRYDRAHELPKLSNALEQAKKREQEMEELANLEKAVEARRQELRFKVGDSGERSLRSKHIDTYFSKWKRLSAKPSVSLLEPLSRLLFLDNISARIVSLAD